MKRLLIVLAILIVLGCLPHTLSAQARSAPKLGLWKITGSDDEGVKWGGSIKLDSRKHVGSLYKYRGHFIWRSSDGQDSGIEYFTGSFNNKNDRVVLVGTRLSRVKGDLALGRYYAFVKNKGRRLSNGTWGGTDVVKGKWSAVWIRSM
ncbi:MAG: hypothetical protein ACKVQJ_13815 [Pyrinomonadaceae bacterium]